jgi:hypothetical protein
VISGYIDRIITLGHGSEEATALSMSPENMAAQVWLVRSPSPGPERDQQCGLTPPLVSCGCLAVSGTAPGHPKVLLVISAETSPLIHLQQTFLGNLNDLFFLRLSERQALACLSCDGGVCIPNNTLCDSSTECRFGYCLKKSGLIATSPDECASGILSNSSHCCDEACSGTCQSCSSGSCTVDESRCDNTTQLCGFASMCLFRDGVTSSSGSLCNSGIRSHSGHCCNTTCRHCNECSRGYCMPVATGSLEPLCATIPCIGKTGGWSQDSTCSNCTSDVPGRCGLTGLCASDDPEIRCAECSTSTQQRPRCGNVTCRFTCPPGRDAASFLDVRQICLDGGESCGSQGQTCRTGGVCQEGSEQADAPSNTVGIVVGVLVSLFVLLAVGVVLFIFFRKPKRSQLASISWEMEGKSFPAMNINAKDLIRGRVLGEGSFGAVYEGQYQGNPVAIKQISSVTSASIGEFFRESSLMMSVPAHANVVRLIGVCQQQNAFSLVLELVPGGSLSSVIMSNKLSTISEAELRRLCEGIAAGMAALAEHNIVHRDLAARNILLSEDLRTPKVSDFGFSRIVGDEGVGKTANDVGPIRWMAPESLKSSVFSEKSDVWSYGCMLIEIFTGKPPFAELDVFKTAVAVRDEGHSPSIPETAPIWAQAIMHQCFHQDPQARPSFQEIRNQLSGHGPGR